MEKDGKMGSNSILIVDDDPYIREMLSDFLLMHKYQVDTADDGLAGWEKFKMCPECYKLVILDVVMPGMDGRDLYFKIKDLKPEVKAIIISGFSKSDIRKELEESGIDGFLDKPFNVIDFFKLLKSII